VAQRYLDLRGYQNAQLKDSELFLVQLWREMFSSSSLDAWQPRTSSVRICLEEILEVIRVVRVQPEYLHNLEHLLAELRRFVSKDPVVSTFYPFLSDKEYLGPFLEGTFVKEHLDKLEETAKVVLGNLADYMGVLVRQLGQMVVEDPREKRKIAALALALGTEISSQGYTPQFLDEYGTKTLLKRQGSFTDRLAELTKRCDGQLGRYTCTFKADLKAYDGYCWETVSLTKDRPQVAPEAAAADFYASAENAVLVNVEAHAVDRYAAVVAAQAQLEKLCAAIDLYTPQHAAQYQKREVLVAEDGGAPEPTTRDNSRNTYWKDAGRPERAVGRVLEVLGRLKHLSPSDAERLTSFLQYHRLALAAETDEGRLVNMWVALESIVRGHGTTIIKAAVDVVPPLVALENTRQHLVAVATYIRQTWRGRDGYSLFKDLLPRSSPKRFDPRDLLDILRGPEEQATRLCKLCKDHPLILHRITELHGDLRSPKSVARWLRRQRQTVEWQIRRIYRARNTVVHQGACPQANMHLNQHLHSYLMQTGQRLIRDIDSYQGSFGLDDAIQNRCHLYRHVLRMLDDEEQRRTVPRTALLEWSVLLRSAAGDSEPAWPEPTEDAVAPNDGSEAEPQ